MKAIVPARGGSKRIPNKNIRLLNNRPLIFYTLDAFQKSKYVDEVIFTSDSQQYCTEVSKFYGHDVTVEYRPKEFATDTTKVVYEIERILQKYNLGEDEPFIMGLPTSPLRSSKHVDEIISLYKEDGNLRFSACEYDFPIQFSFDIDDEGNWVSDNIDSPMITGNTRSQDIPKRYRPNGAMYLNTRGNFIKNMNFYKNAKPYSMTLIDSIDIDNLLDFKIAEIIMKDIVNV